MLISTSTSTKVYLVETQYLDSLVCLKDVSREVGFLTVLHSNSANTKNIMLIPL